MNALSVDSWVEKFLRKTEHRPKFNLRKCNVQMWFYHSSTRHWMAFGKSSLESTHWIDSMVCCGCNCLIFITFSVGERLFAIIQMRANILFWLAVEAALITVIIGESSKKILPFRVIRWCTKTHTIAMISTSILCWFKSLLCRPLIRILFTSRILWIAGNNHET